MAAPSSIKWERSGEPANAFSGLSRGRRGRGGQRGGRGSIRVNSATDVKSQTPKCTPQPQPSQLTTQPTPPTMVAEQPSVLATTHSDAKPPRKSSRGDPSSLHAPRPTVPPSSSRLFNRRKQSQINKTNGNGSNISPSLSTDSQRLVLPSPTLAKDPPPHLQPRTDVRHDIDALVERVRAVAMDNRPTTPGGHIDWAGVDDDSLPDLNDWGVATSTSTSGVSETISPIILEGLKPLPEFSAPTAASPLRQVTTLGYPTTADIRMTAPTSSSGLCEEFTLTPSNPDEDQVTVSNTPVASKTIDPVSQVNIESSEQPLPPKPISASYPSYRKSWHPSLPDKPLRSRAPLVNVRHVATPMRHLVYAKSNMHKGSYLPKDGQSASEQGAVESSSSPVPAEVVSATVMQGVSDTFKTGEDNGHPESAPKSDPNNPTPREDNSDDDSKREGLETSIHAPKSGGSITPSPRNCRVRTKEPNDHRLPSSRNADGDQFNHVNLLKQWNERTGVPSPRNQLSPNGAAGSPKSHRTHASRPIITGDAMSRLARTIGQTNPATGNI